MKKVLIFMLALLMCITALASCAGSNSEQPANASSQGESVAESSKGESAADSSQDESAADSSQDESAADSSQGENTDESSKGESAAETSQEVSAVPKDDSSASAGDTTNKSGLEIMYCSFSEKPYFALLGKCADGATVYGESDGYEYESKSWYGWFSLRLKCTGKSVDVKLYQKVDGETVGEPYVYTATPVTPGADMWPIVTGGDFQFFFQKMLPDFQQKNIPSNSDLSALTSRIKTRLASMRASNPNAEIIYMIVPSEMTVYPELFPEQYAAGTGYSRLELVNAAIEVGGGVVIDLCQTFKQHKNDEMPLYYHLDSHWAEYGAYLAYKELFDYIAKRFPAAAPRDESEFNWNPDYYDSGDMTYYLQMSQTAVKEYGYYRTMEFNCPASITSVPRYRRDGCLAYSDAVTAEMRFDTGRSELPNILLLRDSYSTQLYDIVAERCNKAHYLGMWNYTWYSNVISSEKPDYVVYILSEWNIDSILYS